MFGAPEHSSFFMMEEHVADIPQLTHEENIILTTKFSVDEVYEVISQLEHNKAPGPDGFPAGFYQPFWNVIKDDLMAMFSQLHEADLPLYKLNFGVITLLPKKENAVQIQQYRPICLLNMIFNFLLRLPLFVSQILLIRLLYTPKQPLCQVGIF
jgi:hypothetical protein